MRKRSLLATVLFAHVSAHAAESAGAGNLPFDAAVTGLASTFGGVVLPIVILLAACLVAFHTFNGRSPSSLIPIVGAPIALIASVHVLNLVAASTAQQPTDDSPGPVAGGAGDWLSQYGWMVAVALGLGCVLTYAIIRSTARTRLQEGLKRDKRDLLAAIDLADQAQRYWNARPGQIYASARVQGAQAARQALLGMLGQVHDGSPLSTEQRIAFTRAEAQILKIAVDESDRPLITTAAARVPTDDRADAPRSIRGDASTPRRPSQARFVSSSSDPEPGDNGLLTTLLSASVLIETAAAVDSSSNVDSDSSDRQFECRTSLVDSGVTSESAGSASWDDRSSGSSCDPGTDPN